MNNSQNWLIRLALFLLPIAAIATPPVDYCGGSWDYEYTYYAIIDQRDLVDDRYNVYLNCPEEALCNDNAKTQIDNILAWKSYLGADFSQEDVQKFVYQTDLKFYEDLKDGVLESTLSRKLTKTKYDYFIDYMLLAKNAENSRSGSYRGTGWYQGEQGPAVDKAAVLARAQKLLLTAPDTFMKHRVGFQAVRAAHYLQQNEMALQIFDDNFKERDADYMYYRALEQASGAAYNLKKTDRAISGFVTAFEQLRERRYTNGINLKLAYQQLNDLGGDLSESNLKESFYFYSSYFNNLSVVAAIKKLAAVDVNSPFIDVLLARKIDQLQARLFRDGDGGFYYDWPSTKGYAALSEVIDDQLSKSDLDNKEIYYLLQSLIDINNNNLVEAREKLASINKNGTYGLDAKRMDFIVRTRMVDSVDAQKINELFNELDTTDYLKGSAALSAAFFNQIATVYKNAGNAIGGVLVAVDYGYYGADGFSYEQMKEKRRYNYDFDDRHPFMEATMLEKFREHFVDKEDLTAFEKLVLNRLVTSPADFSHDLMGNHYLTLGKVDEALKEFKQVKEKDMFWEDQVRPEIVSSSIKEWMNVDFGSISDKMHLEYVDLVGETFEVENLEKYRDNKIKLVQLMQELEKEGLKRSKNAADYNYMLGNIWYNISAEGWFVNDLYYVGNNRRNPLKGYSWDRIPMEAKYQQVIDRAADYFQKAVNSQGSRETKAKATFALAKTNRCFSNDYNRSSQSSYLELCGDHVKYFDQLTADYSDTQYYQEILQECSWFVQ